MAGMLRDGWRKSLLIVPFLRAMALVLNTLRNNLLVLFGWLGVMALVVLLWSAGGAVVERVRLSEEIDRAGEADALFRLSYAIGQEDYAMFLALSGKGEPRRAVEAAQRTDEAMVAASARLSDHVQGAHEVALTMIATLRDGLTDRRAAAMAAMRGEDAARGGAIRRWRAFLDATYADLDSIRHELISEAGLPHSHTGSTGTLRHFTLFAMDAVLASRFSIERSLAEPAAEQSMLVGLGEASAVLRGAAALAEEQLLSEPDTSAYRLTGTVVVFLLSDYLEAEGKLLRALSEGRPAAAEAQHWRTCSETALRMLEEAEAALAGEASQRLATADRQINAGLALRGASILLVTALLISAIHMTLIRIVRPLERVHAKMLRLAHDDLTVEIKTRPRLAEIQAMYDALAVFKENALRRARMQAELARLNDRVVEANHAMTAELEAAARVQAAQLPAPCDLPGARFHAFYRPSRMIAGDTYDYVILPDGRTRLFQIDVSGHGAAAALVSVMSHIAVKSAVEAMPDEPLASVVSRINRDWNEDLPYFTMLLVEIDPAAGMARMVQAGHPPLLRLPRTGGVQPVGDGGMPVGALPWAEYEEWDCPFNPGDRLLLTTDGLTEAADATGTLFGEDRYMELLFRYGRQDVKTLFAGIDSALWDWCGTEAFDDDVTLIILEAKETSHAD